MSFTSDVKEEILKKGEFLKPCCLTAETVGERITSATSKLEIEKDYHFNEYLTISSMKECCLKNVIKGAFLSNGYINSPKGVYHLEIVFRCKSLAQYYHDLLSLVELSPKIIRRKMGKNFFYVVYVKESDQISFFLSLIEASSSLLYFEEIRVEKEVKNNINRNVNCEVANLTKTIESASKQCEAIKIIRKNRKFHTLDEKLKQAACMREKYKQDSLEQLAKKINISKSGLKHRLDKLLKMANEMKGEKNVKNKNI